MRFIVLLVGFFIVMFVFGDHGIGFYVGAGIVYVIFKSMDPSNKRGSAPFASPKPTLKLETPEPPAIASPSLAEITNQTDQPMTRLPPGELASESAMDVPRSPVAPSASAAAAERPETKEESQFFASREIQHEIQEVGSPTDSGNATILESGEPDQLVEVRSFASLVEASVAEGLLKSMGIRCCLNGERFVGAGPVSLFVGSRDLEDARNALTASPPAEERKTDLIQPEIESAGPDRSIMSSSAQTISRPRRTKKKIWIAAASFLLLALLYGKPTYQLLKPDDPSDHPFQFTPDPAPPVHRAYSPTVPLFDYSGCVAANEENLRHARQSLSLDSQPPTPHRIASIKWFCSREWDQDRLSGDAAILQAKGFTLCEALASVDASSPRTADCDLRGLPDELKAFCVVFDSVPVVGSLEEQIHPLPVRRTGADARVFGSVIKRPSSELKERIALYVHDKRMPVPYDEDLTQKQQTARDYRIRRDTLNLRIITTVGLRASFRDLYNAAYSSPALTSETQHQESPILSAIDPEKQIDTNTSMGFIWLSASILVKGSIGIIESLHQEGFRDPKTLGEFTMIIVGPGASATGLPSPIVEREGWYDPDTSTMAVNSVVGFEFSRPTSDAQLRERIEQLIPAALSHEIYHHLFYRPSIASSGFELEGEATATGEYAHQMQVQGTRAPADDPIRLKIKKIARIEKEHPGEMTDELADELYKLAQLEQKQGEMADLTPVQCNCLRTITSNARKSPNRIDLAEALTLTSGDLQSRADVSTLYAFAWAIYERSRRDSQNTDTATIERIHDKLHQHLGISDEDRRTLAAIADNTVSWAVAEMKRRNECR